MSRRKDLDFSHVEEVEEVESFDNTFKKPQTGHERVMVSFEKDGYTEDEIKGETQEIIDEKKKEGFIYIRSPRKVNKIWPSLNKKVLDRIRTGRMLCFVWEFSGWFDLLEQPEQKEAFIDKIKKNDQREIMATIEEDVKPEGLYFIDEKQFPQRVRPDSRMHARKKNGDFIYSNNGGASFPKQRRITIDDVPINLIKEIIKRKDIKLITANKKAVK